jgi:hypothetical protein
MSLNKRHYSLPVVERAAPLFEGVKAFADHPPDLKNPRRSVRDAAGVFENVRVEGDRMKATYRSIGPVGDALWPWVVEASKGNHAMGLSINALGKARKGEVDGQKGVIIEEIVKAYSVDIVDEPAAGGQFERLLMGGDPWTEGVLEALELEELREARPDLINALKTEWKTVRDTEALAAARDKSKRLEGELQRAQALVEALEEQTRTLESELLEARVDRLLDSTTLPNDWKASLREEIVTAPPDEWATLIEREVVKAKSVQQTRPVTVRGAGVSMPDTAISAREALLPNPIARDDYDFEKWQRDAQSHQGGK